MDAENPGGVAKTKRLRLATGCYWTPAGVDDDWLSVVVEGGGGADEIASRISVRLTAEHGSEQRSPSEVLAVPSWADVHVARFLVEQEPAWKSFAVVMDGRDAPDSPVPDVHHKASGHRFLILSDLQLLPRVGPTLDAVRGLVAGATCDAVLFPGDFVEAPERKDDWWGDPRGGAFFDQMSPAGGPGLISSTLFVPCIGNHELSAARGSTPAEKLNNVRPDDWNLRVYSRLFGLPLLPPETQKSRQKNIGSGVGPSDYFSVRLGDVWIGSLFVTRAYVKGDHEKREGPAYEWPGRFIFEPVTRESLQYEWLRGELDLPSCRSARVRILLMHHGIFSQGHSSVIPFGTPPDYREDYLVRDLVPLLREGGVHIVFNGHNHIVNHRVVDGIHFVESSHIGTTYKPYRMLPDGEWAPEPRGHPSRLLIHEPGAGFFSVLETEGEGRLVTYRADEEAVVVDEAGLGFPSAAATEDRGMN